MILGARRLVHRSRTNVLDHLSILALWVLDKISDGAPWLEMIA